MPLKGTKPSESLCVPPSAVLLPHRLPLEGEAWRPRPVSPGLAHLSRGGAYLALQDQVPDGHLFRRYSCRALGV